MAVLGVGIAGIILINSKILVAIPETCGFTLGNIPGAVVYIVLTSKRCDGVVVLPPCESCGPVEIAVGNRDCSNGEFDTLVLDTCEIDTDIIVAGRVREVLVGTPIAGQKNK